MTEFVEVKTQDLSGMALNWAVAKVEGVRVSIQKSAHPIGSNRPENCLAVGDMGLFFHPASDWRQAGTLIEKFKIGFGPVRDGWVAHPHRPNEPTSWLRAESALVAICRAIVADKIGMAVSIPKELLS